jgi:hypothetical protein
MSRPSTEPTRARLAFLPGLIGAIVLMAALALIGGAWYVWVLFAVAILALIMCVFAVLWLRLFHLAGAVVFIAAGISIKVPVEAGRQGPAGRYDGKTGGSGRR